MRPLRVRLVDGTAKVVIIDGSKSVKEISDQVGEKIGVKQVDEFSLRRTTPPGMSKARKCLIN